MATAAQLGLADKDNWRKQPKVMRKWRAVAACARVVFSDVITGLYTPEEMGIEAFEKRKESRSGIYSFENETAKLDENLERIFKENKEAWNFFSRQAPSYRKTALRWIMTARQEITKLNRLNKLIEASEKQKRAF